MILAILRNFDDVAWRWFVHMPDPKRALGEQGNWDAWLHGTVEQASVLIKLPSLELFSEGPEDSASRVQLDLATGQPAAQRDAGKLF